MDLRLAKTRLAPDRMVAIARQLSCPHRSNRFDGFDHRTRELATVQGDGCATLQIDRWKGGRVIGRIWRSSRAAAVSSAVILGSSPDRAVRSARWTGKGRFESAEAPRARALKRDLVKPRLHPASRPRIEAHREERQRQNRAGKPPSQTAPNECVLRFAAPRPT